MWAVDQPPGLPWEVRPAGFKLHSPVRESSVRPSLGSCRPRGRTLAPVKARSSVRSRQGRSRRTRWGHRIGVGTPDLLLRACELREDPVPTEAEVGGSRPLAGSHERLCRGRSCGHRPARPACQPCRHPPAIVTPRPAPPDTHTRGPQALAGDGPPGGRFCRISRCLWPTPPAPGLLPQLPRTPLCRVPLPVLRPEKE